MFEITTLIAAIIAVTQLVKKAGVVGKYTPVVALVLGIAGGVLFTEGDIAVQIVNGVVIGLASSGLYDVGKIPVKMKTK